MKQAVLEMPGGWLVAMLNLPPGVRVLAVTTAPDVADAFLIVVEGDALSPQFEVLPGYHRLRATLKTTIA